MGTYANPIMKTSPLGNEGAPPKAGQNQHGMSFGMSMPGNTPSPRNAGGGMFPNPYQSAANNPYQVPSSGGPMNYPWGSLDPSGAGGSGTPGHSTNEGHGIVATGLQYPGMSQDFVNYLMTQIGSGMAPFNLQTPLPTGGTTQVGQLTAGLEPLLQQLNKFFMGGKTNIPGMNTMADIANNGISALPEWQAMIKAQHQNIEQNQANLKEQFGSMGDLAGSPFGTAMSNYMSQTSADQNALLGQLQQTNILQGQLPMLSNIFQGSQAMGGGLQALDQQAVQNQYQEFMRTQAQNNPMLQYIMGMSTLFPPTNKTPTTWENVNSTIGALSGSGFNPSTGAMTF